MTLFRPVFPKKTSPTEFRAFQHGLFCGRCLFLVVLPVLGRKNPLVLIWAALFFPMQFPPPFSLQIYVFYRAETGGIY